MSHSDCIANVRAVEMFRNSEVNIYINISYVEQGGISI
jgi:hypothetical protein